MRVRIQIRTLLKSDKYHTNRVPAERKVTIGRDRLLRTGMQSSRLKSFTPGDEEEDYEVDNAEYLGNVGRMFVISKKEEDHF